MGISEEGLQLIGLTKNDSNTYLAIAHFGPLTVSDIEKKLGIHRRNVHDSLNRLYNKGLISNFIHNKKQVYQITNVEKVTTQMKEKQQIITKTIQNLKSIKKQAKIPEIHVYSGEKRVKYHFDDQVRVAKPVYALAISEFESQIWDYLEKNPHLITRGNAPSYLLYTESARNLAKRAIEYDFVKEIRIIPDSYNSSVGFDVYGNNVALLMDNSIIRIRDKGVTKRFKQLFDSLWKIGKKL